MKEALGDLGLFALFEAMTLILASILITEPFDYAILIGAIVSGAFTILHAVVMISKYEEWERHELMYRLLITKYLVEKGFPIDQIIRKEIPGECMDELAKSLNAVYEALAEHESEGYAI